jgi:hypothetical protein
MAIAVAMTRFSAPRSYRMVSLVADRNRQTAPAQNRNALIGRSLCLAVLG